MNRFKKKEPIALGEPLPLPYKIEPIVSKTAPIQDSKEVDSNEDVDNQQLLKPFKRILVGRLRNTSNHTNNYNSNNNHSQYHNNNRNNDIHGLEPYGVGSGSSGFNNPNGMNGSRNSSINVIKPSRISSKSSGVGSLGAFQLAEVTSKLHRIHSKLDLIENSFKSEISAPSMDDIERRLRVINSELDELGIQMRHRDPREGLVDEAPYHSYDEGQQNQREEQVGDEEEFGEDSENELSAANVSVFDELDRIRKQTQSRQQQLQSHRERQTQIVSLSFVREFYKNNRIYITISIAMLIIFFISSYFVSSLTYEYCYYYC